MSDRWRKFDMRVDRGGSELSPEDNCFYYLDHTEGGYSVSEANQKVFNLKKPMRYKGRSGWHYKNDAIRDFSNDLTDFLIANNLANYDAVMVAVPPSKRRDHIEYDDRIVQVIQNASAKSGVDWLDPFDVINNSNPAHVGGDRSFDFLESNIVLNETSKLLKNYSFGLIIDDVLTSGNHYIVCKNLIEKTAPTIQTIGVFWALHRPSDPADDFMNGW